MKSFVSSSKIKYILLTGIVAGTLDILCAIFILAKGNATGVFRHIAKGAFGPAALEGGTEMILWGVLFHYLIATCFTAGYFMAYPFVPFLSKHKILSGLLYGFFVWAFMNFLVLPLTFNPPAPLSLAVWKSIVILMLALGLPISYLANYYYTRKSLHKAAQSM